MAEYSGPLSEMIRRRRIAMEAPLPEGFEITDAHRAAWDRAVRMEREKAEQRRRCHALFEAVTPPL
jgi:hypothetical protein